MDIVSALVILAVGLALGATLGVLWARSRPADDDTLLRLETRASDQTRVTAGLDRLHDQMDQLRQERTAWQSQLNEQVGEMRRSAESLRRETGSLATALRKPQVRGAWGELQLRRSVELAGLVERCDFSEQLHLPGSGQRPDLVVHLPGGGQVVVDAKVPLEAFLDATRCDDEEPYRHHLARHARQLRAHADALSAKAYWRELPDTPEFVVLFVPSEAFLSAALDAEPGLIEWAAERQVVLATPTTLIALLRTVALGWSQVSLADHAREIHALGRELHERLGSLGGHLDRLGRSLTGSVAAYNAAVGSLESRVLVSARKFTELDPGTSPLETVRVVEESPRPLSATELLDDASEEADDAPQQAARPAHLPRRVVGGL